MRGGKIPTYIGIGLVFSIAIYTWTVFGSSPQSAPEPTALPSTPTDTPAPWWYFATPVIATNTPEPTATREEGFGPEMPDATESCPALQTPTPPVINIVLPPVVISTPLATPLAMVPTIVASAEVSATMTATATPLPTPTPTPPGPASTPAVGTPAPTPELPTITKIFGPVVAHGVVNTNVLRLRYGPSEKRGTVVFLFDGSMLDIYGKSPDGKWLGVRVTGTGLYGWVYARYVKIEKWETGGRK